MKQSHRYSAYILVFLALLGGITAFGTIGGLNMGVVMTYMQERPVAGAFIYVTFLALSIFVMPFASLPLLPFAGGIWGVWIGTLLSVLGWWIGAMIAFLLARWFGRPILERFISLEQLDEWEEDIPEDVTFWGIILLRIMLPVEIPSIMLAFIKTLSFRIYSSATFVGIIPFAFLWVVFGQTLFERQWALGGLLLMMIGVGLYLMYRIREHCLR